MLSHLLIISRQKGREESCEMDDPLPGQKVAQLYNIENWQLFYGNFIRPKIKVGTEWVYKGQNAGEVKAFIPFSLKLPLYNFPLSDQCLNAIAALARSTYNRMFAWLVDLCNRTLIVSQAIIHRKVEFGKSTTKS